MQLSDFRSQLDSLIEEHNRKAAEYGAVKETFISMTNELVWILSEFEGGEAPSEFNTALVMTADTLEVKYEYVL